MEENSHAIGALKRKRAELSGELAELEKQRRAICNRINHVDETLRLFGYQGDPKDIPAKRRKRWLFKRGHLQRRVYALLREASGPIGNREMAAVIIRELGWDTEDGELLGLIAGKVKDVRKRALMLTPTVANTLSTGG
ncbi:MAG: hypothetical protein KDA48_08455 [Amphiplicatus sp.]|nr:hypothetical protein [Amphiplicatus sp.]